MRASALPRWTSTQEAFLPETLASGLSRPDIHEQECDPCTPFLLAGGFMSVAAWYHLSVKPVQRSAGRSVVAAAAYRLGARLEDHQYAELREFSRRGGVLSSFTLAPAGAPDWACDPESLWNAAEAAETRRNAQVAREFEIALPSAVSFVERESIARDFAQALVDRYGVAVSVGLHAPSRYGDDRNYHAHILATTREVGEDGLGKKTRILDDFKTGPQEVRYLRELAAGLINESLERAGSEERVDHRSFKDRGIEKEPSQHLGPTASEMENRGEPSDIGDINREIAERNRQYDELFAEFAAVEAEIRQEEERRLDDLYGPPDPTPLDEYPLDPDRQETDETIDGPPPAVVLGPSEDQLLEQYAEPFKQAVSETGEVPHHDGLRWWERAVGVLTTWRDTARDWVSTSWQRIIDRWEGPDDTEVEREDPELER